MRRSHAVLLIGLSGVTVASAAISARTDTKLMGTTGPGFSISLRDAQGNAVTKLDPGAFEIEVDDRSEEHNFHLIGPGGVDVRTQIETTGVQTFNVTLVDGRYTFQCDPHAPSMSGAFTVGNAPPPHPPPPPPPPSPPSPPPATAKPSAPVGARLALTVGPAYKISLKTGAGKAVKLLRPGRYTVVVRDRGAIHNARLKGAGAAKATGIGFVGTKTWKVVLRKGTLVFQCDPHRTAMRGTVKIA